MDASITIDFERVYAEAFALWKQELERDPSAYLSTWLDTVHCKYWNMGYTLLSKAETARRKAAALDAAIAQADSWHCPIVVAHLHGQIFNYEVLRANDMVLDAPQMEVDYYNIWAQRAATCPIQPAPCKTPTKTTKAKAIQERFEVAA